MAPITVCIFVCPSHSTTLSPCSLPSCRSDYVWLMVIGSMASFMAAWGIGANDVANSFATSELLAHTRTNTLHLECEKREKNASTQHAASLLGLQVWVLSP